MHSRLSLSQEKFYAAIKSKDISTVNTMLSLRESVLKTMDPANPHDEYFLELASQDGLVDLAADNCKAIRVAAECGSLEIIKLLMRCEGVDPVAGSNAACQHGDVEVVKLLLACKGVNPAAKENAARIVFGRAIKLIEMEEKYKVFSLWATKDAEALPKDLTNDIGKIMARVITG